VAFVVDETFSTISGEEITDIYQLVIEKISNEIEPFDAKVSKTIEKIIEQFFENVQNSLIYVCSEDNRKAKSRQNTFNRWYNNSTCKNKIKKIDNVIHFQMSETELQKIYTSFLFHINNLNQAKLIEIYEQIERVLNDEK
jgi:ribonucleotide reductase beta subunit family protein with ferritin-like domain